MLSAGAESRRRRALAVLALLALAMHGLLIGGIEITPARHELPGAARSLQVRTIVAPVLAVPEPPAPPPPAPVAVAKAVVPAERRAAPAPAESVPPEGDPASSSAEPLLNPEPLHSANPTSLPLPAEVEAQAAAASAVAASAVAPAAVAAAEPQAVVAASAAPLPASAALAESAPPPRYATRLPPAVTLRYELRRGRLSGSGDLLWRPDGSRYGLRLEGSVVGVNVLTQVSEGAIDADGLAPSRFTDQRARRAAVAANFEREAGRIRFSGPSHEVPWQPGVQDRLSWMVQLAAVSAAEPARLAVGERIVLQVVGARGDASLWAFRSEGPQTLTLFSTPVETVKLLREPRSAHDTRVEVWLDPARHHLPVRATLGSGEDDPLELRLREMLP